MTIYTLYKTERIETGEYYVGIHKINTEKFPRFNDGYLGSGDRIQAAIKKHGKKAFKRSLLAISEDPKEIELLEEQTVTREMITDPLCLNIAIGGRSNIKGQKRQTSIVGWKHSEESKRKNSESNKNRVVVKNLETGEVYRVSSSEFYKNKGILYESPVKEKWRDHKYRERRREAQNNHHFYQPIKKECNHCHKIVDLGNYAKLHGDRCRMNPNRTLERFLE